MLSKIALASISQYITTTKSGIPVKAMATERCNIEYGVKKSSKPETRWYFQLLDSVCTLHVEIYRASVLIIAYSLIIASCSLFCVQTLKIVYIWHLTNDISRCLPTATAVSGYFDGYRPSHSSLLARAGAHRYINQIASQANFTCARCRVKLFKFFSSLSSSSSMCKERRFKSNCLEQY